MTELSSKELEEIFADDHVVISTNKLKVLPLCIKQINMAQVDWNRMCIKINNEFIDYQVVIMGSIQSCKITDKETFSQIQLRVCDLTSCMTAKIFCFNPSKEKIAAFQKKFRY